MHILGITGGVATGKSTVTKMFGELGAPIVDADAIARALLMPGTQYSEIVALEFPDCVQPDSGITTIDRRMLGKRVFADPEARAKLESILHPPIREEMQLQIDKFLPLSNPPICAVEIPLLFESRLEYMVDSILVVVCSEDVQIERLMKRSHLSHGDALQQIRSQLSLEHKIQHAGYIVHSDTSLDDMRRHVINIWHSISMSRE